MSMKLSELKVLANGLIDSDLLSFTLQLRDAMFKKGVTLDRAKKIASLVSSASPPDDEYIDELASILCHMVKTLLPEVGEDAFYLFLDNMPSIEKG